MKFWMKCQITFEEECGTGELCLTRLAIHNLKLQTGIILNRCEISEYPTYLGFESVERRIFKKVDKIVMQPVTPFPDFIKTEQIDSAIKEHFKEFKFPLSLSHQLILPISCFNDFKFSAVLKITKIDPEISGQFIFGDLTEVYLKLQTVKDEKIPSSLQQSFYKSYFLPRDYLFSSFPNSDGLESFFKTTDRYGKYPLSTALVYGPFGAGKRTLIRRIADDSGVPFYLIDLYNLKDEYYVPKSQKFPNLLAEKFEMYDTIVLDGLELLDEEMKIRSIWAQISRINSDRNLKLIASYSFMNSKSVPDYILGSFDFADELKVPGSSAVKKLTKELVELVPEAADLISSEDEFIGYSLEDFADLMERFKRKDTKSFETVLNEYKKLIKLRKSIQSNTLEIPKVSWDEVAGLTEVKEVLKDLIGKLQKKPRPTGVLLHGPPGTGKTLIAKALATQSRFALLPVKGPEFLSPYIGESESALRDIFTQARSMSPCIIFFDELDALVPKRGEFGDSVGVSDRMVATFMTEMDKINGLNQTSLAGADDGCVFVIGATNRPDLIDSALMRKGRFDLSILLDAPKTIEERAAILAASCSKLNCAPGINFLEPFKHVIGAKEPSPAQIAAIATNASKMALEKKLAQLRFNPDEKNLLIDPITTDDLINSITQLFK